MDTAGKFHGFIKTGSKFQAINFPKAVLTQAYHLNDQGQIAGFYTDTAGTTHGFIARPNTTAQEPDSESESQVSENQ